MTKGSKNMELVEKDDHNSGCSDCSDCGPTCDNQMNIRLQAMMNYAQLPKVIKTRLHALKNFQLEAIKIDESFFHELKKLEVVFAEQYQAIYNKRQEIVTGAREPTDLEAEYHSDEDSVDELAEEIDNKVAITNGIDVNGIPEFWLKVLQHSEMMSVNIQEHDVKVLKHLMDIKCVINADEDHGFTLEFYFAKNDYFTNEKLTKQYFVQMNASSTYPLSYEGPEMVRTKGCPINWYAGKNVTVKLVKKVQKSKNKNDKKTVTKSVKTDSFFNFFDPPTDSLYGDDDIQSDIENILEADFEMAEFIRDRIIPRAVLYYTGEAINVDYEDDEDYDEEESEEDSDDCQSRIDSSNLKRTIKNDENPECKQQ